MSLENIFLKNTTVLKNKNARDLNKKLNFGKLLKKTTECDILYVEIITVTEVHFYDAQLAHRAF